MTPLTRKMSKCTVREINAHLWGGTGSCYVTTEEGFRFRVSRVRTRKGMTEGRIINGSARMWEWIPSDATVELWQ